MLTRGVALGPVRRVPYRVAPRMAVQQYQTFSVHMPAESHWRPASCEEVDCPKWRNGWKTSFVPGTADGDKIRFFIKNSTIKRTYTVVRLADRTEVVFPAGMECFKQDHPSTRHRLPIPKPQIHVVRGGDWRASTTERKVVKAPEWVDRFATNQDKLKTLIERG